MLRLLKNRGTFLLVAGLFALALSGCGYRFGRGEIARRFTTICVPYVEGDDQGIMTQSLIYALSSGGSLSYRSYGSDLLLKVCLFEPEDTTIGFAYAPKKHRRSRHIVVSNEARLTLAARFTLIDQKTATAILGPIEVRSFLDYDYEPDLGKINANAFSLGQLEMHNLAQDTAFPPLYSLLAKKIVDYINNS